MMALLWKSLAGKLSEFHISDLVGILHAYPSPTKIPRDGRKPLKICPTGASILVSSTTNKQKTVVTTTPMKSSNGRIRNNLAFGL